MQPPPVEYQNLFSALKSETQQAIAQRAYTRSLPEGSMVLIEGMPAESCYFVISGEVRALRMNTEGRVQVLARFTTGDPVNIISLLSEEKINRATIETISPTSFLVLQAKDFEYLISHYTDFSNFILQHLAARLSKITNLAANLSLYAVRARLARFLIELADLNPSPSGWTQDEIAAHIGTVRDVVGRLLRDFESAGLIQRQRGEIILQDRGRLTQISQE